MLATFRSCLLAFKGPYLASAYVLVDKKSLIVCCFEIFLSTTIKASLNVIYKEAHVDIPPALSKKKAEAVTFYRATL